MSTNYSKYVDDGCKLFDVKNNASVVCMLGIGAIISKVTERDECTTRVAIEILSPAFFKRGHDYKECYYYQAHRMFTTLTEHQREVVVDNCIPIQDAWHICSDKMEDKRDKIIEDVEKKGWEPYKNLYRKYMEKKNKNTPTTLRNAAKSETAVRLPELPEEWTVDDMEKYFLGLFSHSVRKYGTAPDKLAKAFDNARVAFDV